MVIKVQVILSLLTLALFYICYFRGYFADFFSAMETDMSIEDIFKEIKRGLMSLTDTVFVV